MKRKHLKKVKQDRDILYSMKKESSASKCPVENTRLSALHAAPIHIQVTAAPQRNLSKPDFGITFYSISLSCPLTKSLWTCRLRFSQVYTQRQYLLRLMKLLPPFHCCSLSPLEAIPRRRLGMDDPFIIAERVRGLTTYFHGIMQLREDCIEILDEGLEPELIEVLRNQIEKDIQMPSMHTEAENEWRSRSSVATTLDIDNIDDSTCAICLDALSDGSVRLRCSHAYHHDCVTSWLSRLASCPLCRADA